MQKLSLKSPELLAKMAGQLGSDNDGIALTAARKLDAAIKAEGLDWGAIFGAVVSNGDVVTTAPTSANWRHVYEECWRVRMFLHDRDRRFLDGVSQVAILSEKQSAWLADVHRRASEILDRERRECAA